MQIRPRKAKMLQTFLSLFYEIYNQSSQSSLTIYGASENVNDF